MNAPLVAFDHDLQHAQPQGSAMAEERRLAICIKGGVSLGAYEAGVLAETLELIANNNSRPNTIPWYIDTLAGERGIDDRRRHRLHAPQQYQRLPGGDVGVQGQAFDPGPGFAK